MTTETTTATKQMFETLTVVTIYNRAEQGLIVKIFDANRGGRQVAEHYTWAMDHASVALVRDEKVAEYRRQQAARPRSYAFAR